MSGNTSAQKRHRQNEKLRLRNKIMKTKVRNLTKIFLNSVSESNKEEANQNYTKLTSLLDRAYQKGIYKRNNTARKKSRLFKMLNK